MQKNFYLFQNDYFNKQSFIFDKSAVADSEFILFHKTTPAGYFLKKILYLLLVIYSTLFLAVAIPFLNTPFFPIYFAGLFIFILLSLMLANDIMMFKNFKNGKIRITPEEIQIIADGRHEVVSADGITGLGLNILGTLAIRSAGSAVHFPASLLNEEDRLNLLNMFKDANPVKTSVFRKIIEFFDAVSVALVLAVHIIQYIIQAYYIPTGSMMDTLRVGDHLFVEKITYGPIIPEMLGMGSPVHMKFMGIREVRRGDIVIFRPPHEKDKDYIKRCIAIPGDRLEIKDGAVIINGSRKDESAYVKGETHDNASVSRVQGIVPEGKIVVMGDNRENSMDGRSFGYLDIEKIKGKAFFLYWNTEQIRKLDFSRIGFIR